MKNKHVELVINAIKKVAHQAKKSEQDVSRNEILEHVSDWTVKRAGSISTIKNAYFPTDEKDLKGIHKSKVQASYISKLENRLGDRDFVLDEISNAISKIKLPKFKSVKVNKKKQIKRIVNVLFSDLHIGSDIKKEETGQLDFGKVEEARRLAKLTQEIISYKPQYRADTKLNLFLLGDIIQNHLHDPRDGAPLAEQVARAIYLLSQSISHLVASFPQVEVYCAVGNHGRDVARHHSRAVNQKWDSIETIIYFSLKEVFKNNKNISFVIPKTPYVVAEVFGKKMFMSHGDTVLKPGYPNKAIKVGSLEEQINKINASLPDDQEYSVFSVGHVHVGSITHLANGAVMITNGCMVPSDEFAVSIGLLENVCGQYLFESVPGYPVGDCRFIKISNQDDLNKELDKTIKPFVGLDEEN